MLTLAQSSRSLSALRNPAKYAGALSAGGRFPLRGKWNAEIYKRDAPLVLELGCGGGEYTLGLARLDPQRRIGAGIIFLVEQIVDIGRQLELVVDRDRSQQLGDGVAGQEEGRRRLAQTDAG